jgi:hypothetical protein
MSFISKVVVAWDLFVNWLRDSPSGRSFSGSTAPTSVKVFRFEIHDNHIHIQAKTPSARSLSMILDTGGDQNALNASLCDDLEVKHKVEINLSAAGTGEDKTAVYFTKTIPLDLVGIPLRTNIFVPLKKLEAGIGRTIDGILGSEIFHRCVVEIDYQTQTIKLHPANTYTASPQGVIIPISLVRRRPFVRAQIKFPGREAIEGKFIIDTGDSSGLSLHSRFVQKHALLSQVSNGIPHFTSGIAGEAKEILGRAEHFLLGEKVIERPVVAFSQAEKGSTADASYDGAIGGEILRRFKLTLDYSRGQMILEPNGNLAAPFEVDMSGMDLVAQGKAFATIQVLRVYENTPASQAGLRPGDILLEINGTAAGELGLEQVRQLFKLDEREYHLSLQRDGLPLHVGLVTRRLI